MNVKYGPDTLLHYPTSQVVCGPPEHDGSRSHIGTIFTYMRYVPSLYLPIIIHLNSIATTGAAILTATLDATIAARSVPSLTQ